MVKGFASGAEVPLAARVQTPIGAEAGVKPTYCPPNYFYTIFNNKNQKVGFVSSLPYIYLKSFALFASKRSDYYKITGMYQTHIFSC